MDPVSQACFGASLSQSFAKDKSKQFIALVIGALAGMAPDLDVYITSTKDPLLFLEYHRQFTHSLFFIPFGALICALILYPFIKSKLNFKQIYLFSFLGYATHGLLDSCTSYGTQLFWPFSSQRISWNIVSIIDPLFTLPVLFFILLAVFYKKVHYARLAFIYAVIFLCLGFVQKYRAQEVVYEIAQQRGHMVERVLTKPTFANRHVWKTIYEFEGYYYVDAVKLLWSEEFIPGVSIQKLDLKRDFPWLPKGSQQAIDVERFRWFSDDYLAVSKKDKNTIMDIRYSFVPNRINSMWNIEVNKGLIDEGELSAHVRYIVTRDITPEIKKRFLDMVF